MTPFRAIVVAALVASGAAIACSDKKTHPPFISSACSVPPCSVYGGPGGRAIPDAGTSDAAADHAG